MSGELLEEAKGISRGVAMSSAQTSDWPLSVRGDASGLDIPAHPEAFRAAGIEFLNSAFEAFGTLTGGNRIVAIKRCDPCPGGATGHKLFLTVDYARPDPALDTELFVKFSRDFTDAIRDAQSFEMGSEVHLARLSRHPAFPITVPATYFADFEQASNTCILITSRIRFGEGPIEPQKQKCMDHLLADPLEYYRAILTALGRVVAAHKSGRLSPEVDETFPFDREAAADQDKIPYDEHGLLAQLDRFVDLANRAPQLFPPHLRAPGFVARLKADALRFLEHERAVKQFLHADPDYIALCHWNANIDNAWFWRSPQGELQCGLFDWGRVRQLNLAYAVWGCLLAAPTEIWDEHLDELLELLVSEIRAGGGPSLQSDEIRLHLHLYVATMGLATAIVAPDRILYRQPNAVDATGPRDPMFMDAPQARNFLLIFTNFLNLWEKEHFGRSLDLMLERQERT